MITFRSDNVIQKRGFQLYFSYFPLGKYSENTLNSTFSHLEKLGKVNCFYTQTKGLDIWILGL